MKISNYMNNTNSIMEKNTDKVQKGNSQTNEKHTVGQSVKLSISNEGLEYYRNRIQQSGQEKYDDVVQRKELLASKKSVILIIVMKFKRRQHSRIKMLIQEKVPQILLTRQIIMLKHTQNYMMKL